MDFITKLPNGKVLFRATSREKLRRYYLKSFPYKNISPLFNSIAPEIKNKHQLPAEVVKKIVTELGLAEVEADIRDIE